MNTTSFGMAASVALLSLGLSASAQAQQTSMTFFITSVGSGKGADLGGLAGADKHCQSLAKAAGAGKRTWRAYLSTSASGGFTGSQPDGTAFAGGADRTCGNWTKSGEGAAMVGHHDRRGLRDDEPSRSWNSSHPSRGCSQDALRSSGGAGLLYCFDAN